MDKKMAKGNISGKMAPMKKEISWIHKDKENIIITMLNQAKNSREIMSMMFLILTLKLIDIKFNYF